MNFYENNLVALIEAHEKLTSDAVDVQAGDQDCNTVIEEHLTELQSIVSEFRKIHIQMLKQNVLLKQLQEIEL